MRVLLPALISMTLTAAAQTNIVFFGNSFTYYNALPTIVSQLIESAGAPTANVRAQTSGGWTLDNHITLCTSQGTNGIIHTGLAPGADWDYAVIQEYSTKPTRIGNPADFRADAVALQSLVRARSSNVIAVLYQTWARPDLCPPYGTSFPSLQEMQNDLLTNYTLAVHDLGSAAGSGALARFAGVGEAFRTADWPLNLYDTDRYHPSKRGSLLAGMVIFRTLYHASVKAIPEERLGALLASLGLTLHDWRALCECAEPRPDLPRTVLLADLGAPELPTPGAWNNLTNPASGAVWNARDTNDTASGFSLAVTRAFDGADASGVAGAWQYPASAQRDSFIVRHGTTAEVTLAGLEPAWTCDVTLFASSTGHEGKFISRYRVGEEEMTLDAENNVLRNAHVGGIVPQTSAVTITVGRASAADVEAHLSALQVTEYSGPHGTGQRWLFDFGGVAYPSSGAWNNVMRPAGTSAAVGFTGMAVTNAIDTAGVTTDVCLVIADDFQGVTDDSVITGFPYPDNAARDSFWVGQFGGGFNTQAVMHLAPLAAPAYIFTFYGYRSASGYDRTSAYVFAEGTALLSSVQNKDVVALTNVAPDATGVVSFVVKPLNHHNVAYGHLNVLQVDAMLTGGSMRVWQFDFGPADGITSGAWNNVTNWQSGATCADAVATNGVAGPLSLAVAAGFDAAAARGADTNVLVPASAQRDSFLVTNDAGAMLVLTGLVPTNTYEVRLFASRVYTAPNRRTHVSAPVAATSYSSLNTSMSVVRLVGLAPAPGGDSIALQFTADGSGSEDYGSAGVMQIEVLLPEPAGAASLLLAIMLLRRQRGKALRPPITSRRRWSDAVPAFACGADTWPIAASADGSAMFTQQKMLSAIVEHR